MPSSPSSEPHVGDGGGGGGEPRRSPSTSPGNNSERGPATPDRAAAQYHGAFSDTTLSPSVSPGRIEGCASPIRGAAQDPGVSSDAMADDRVDVTATTEEAKRSRIVVHSVSMPPSSGDSATWLLDQPPVRTSVFAAGLQKRATHGSTASLHSMASASSNCQVRRNSLKFTRSDSDESSVGNSTMSSVDGAHSVDTKDNAMEVMDLRPTEHASMLIAMASNIGADEEGEGLFHVANVKMGSPGDGLENVEGGGRGGRRDSVRTIRMSGNGPGSDRPTYHRTESETEQAYRALVSMMGNEGFDDSVRIGNSGRVSRRGSFNSARTDFWSALGPRPVSSVSSGSSGRDDDAMSEGSRGSGGSTLTNPSLPEDDDKKKLRRKLISRRCTKALLAVVLLAALSVLVIYFVADDYEFMSDFLPDLFGGGSEGDDEDKRRLPQDGQLSLRDRNRVARNKRVRAKERARRTMMLSDGYYNGENVADERYDYHQAQDQVHEQEGEALRRTMMLNDGYYGGGNVVDERYYYQQEQDQAQAGQPFYEDQRRGSAQEDPRYQHFQDEPFLAND